jgi:hypothetical protein
MLGWIQTIPLEYRFELPDGTRVLCVHASPGADDGPGINPIQTNEEVEGLLHGCDANLVLVGHTHFALDRTVGGVRVVNPGSVAYPWAPEFESTYALIEADEAGHTIDICRVPLDVEAVVSAIEASSYYPNPEWLLRRYAPDRRPTWDHTSTA